jgi:hypothetical protein
MAKDIVNKPRLLKKVVERAIAEEEKTPNPHDYGTITTFFHSLPAYPITGFCPSTQAARICERPKGSYPGR